MYELKSEGCFNKWFEFDGCCEVRLVVWIWLGVRFFIKCGSGDCCDGINGRLGCIGFRVLLIFFFYKFEVMYDFKLCIWLCV